jgi:hypothetical protein
MESTLPWAEVVHNGKDVLLDLAVVLAAADEDNRLGEVDDERRLGKVPSISGMQ